ncbi:MAG: serine/threonine protein kinase, partial [Pseudohongiellaceae bacterium]
MDGTTGGTDWGQLAELFHQALERTPDERSSFLDKACGEDQALRRELDEMLAADDGDLGSSDMDLAPSADALAAALDSANGDPVVGSQLGPWTLQRLIGTGGMGRVYLASRTGADFEQQAAVKLIRPGLAGDEILDRFRHERATLARLEHPGIARLLDGGAGEDGTPWLAMEYVNGEPLDEWCAERRLSVDDRLELFLGVCDAVASAHSQLVIHRDLKPSNILVDQAGKPRLLDFGVAKVLASDGDVAVTVTAGVPMTPAYASPEQVLGSPVGTGCDVYALGVILYELLSGCRPYSLDDQTVAGWQRAICEQLPRRPSTAVLRDDALPALAVPSFSTDSSSPRSAPPSESAAAPSQADRCSTDLHGLRSRLSGDLDNITLMALAKEPERRYLSVSALADDVRRHLGGLPVAAHAPSLAYATHKFVGRHRAASALGSALLLAVVGTVILYVLGLQRDQSHLAEILRLADGYNLEDLVAEMEGPLWPVLPDSAAPIDNWLSGAAALLARSSTHEQNLARLAEALSAGEAAPGTLWWHDQLLELTEKLSAFAADEPLGATVSAMELRRTQIDELARLSLIDPAADWERALASIADVEQCPQYEGLVLPPQWGLAPLRRDPDSGLWEFWVVLTGTPPEVDVDDALVMTEESAVVLVLLPGGTGVMGSQANDSGAPHYDPRAAADEQPVHTARLDPFFLSKYEMTQGQWLRVTGGNASEYRPGNIESFPTTLAHPVEKVAWVEAHEALRRIGLVLPTEMRWEYACRAGTDTPWWSGHLVGLLDTVANLCDLHARDH